MAIEYWYFPNLLKEVYDQINFFYSIQYVVYDPFKDELYTTEYSVLAIIKKHVIIGKL
jgi:hypothetical protein